MMRISLDQLRRHLLQNNCSLTETGQAMGLSAQRVEQLMKAVGLRFVKGLVEVEPQAKSLLNAKDKK